MFPLLFDKVSYVPPDSKQRLINQMQLQIDQAGTLAILGPNGAGKSIFLRLAHQLIEPTEGRIYWQNKNETNKSSQRQSMVFQQPVMLKRSVYANLDYALKLKPIIPSKRNREVIMGALDEVGLSNQAHQAANSLSIGEQQKLAICRALITQPKVVFLDEPTASLDPSATHQIEVILGKVANTETKLIVATHDLMQAKRIADDVLLIHHGEVVEYSNAESFFSDPKTDLAAQFIAGELLWN
jgi:tungstate transport system ATP-binding protein